MSSHDEHNSTPLAHPFVKWAGGKTQILPEIRKRIPSSWDPGRDLYAEPFVGAGALFFDLRPRRAWLNDLCPGLWKCWVAVQDDVVALVYELRALERKYREKPEEAYYEVRSQDEEILGRAEAAARFIFLNKTCFNGLYRVNKSGAFNVPWGKNPAVRIVDEENLRACADLLRDDVRITCQDFAGVGSRLPRGSLVYLDPPYSPLTKTACFTSFTKEGFKAADQVRLADYAESLRDQCGCHVILSMSGDEEVVDLYRDRGFYCDYVSSRRAINSRGYGRGKVGEYVATSDHPRKLGKAGR